MDNPFLPEEWIDRHHPIDDIEPDIPRANAIRDARVKCILLLNAGFGYIEAALVKPGATVQDVAIALYQSAYGMGLSLCDGMSMTDRSQIWGVERATISKGAISFCAGNALPPSFYMKKEVAQGSYRHARLESIRQVQQAEWQESEIMKDKESIAVQKIDIKIGKENPQPETRTSQRTQANS